MFQEINPTTFLDLIIFTRFKIARQAEAGKNLHDLAKTLLANGDVMSAIPEMNGVFLVLGVLRKLSDMPRTTDKGGGQTAAGEL